MRRPKLSTLKPRLGALDYRVVKPAAKVADPHYGTPEHAAWREAVLAKAGRRCEWIEAGTRCSRCAPLWRLTADHVVELQDGGSALDPENGQALCDEHHGLKTHRARQARAIAAGSQQGALRPEWLLPAVVPLTLVCGPPASGKTSYVAERAGQRDLVLDLDKIASVLAGSSMHGWGPEWLGPALRRRNELLGDLARKPPKWPAAWLILTEPKSADRDWWARKLRPKAIVVLETSDAECWRRIAADPERTAVRGDQSAAVAKWWAEYQRRDGEHQITDREQ
jgi:hypothetical protein